MKKLIASLSLLLTLLVMLTFAAEVFVRDKGAGGDLLTFYYMAFPFWVLAYLFLLGLSSRSLGNCQLLFLASHAIPVTILLRQLFYYLE